MMRYLWTLTILFSSLFVAAQEKKSVVKKICEDAQTAYEAAEYTKALDLVNKCLEEDPGNADAYLTRAATREELKDLPGANSDYSIYNEMNPDQPDALYSLATVRYKIGFYDQAKTDLLKLLKLPHGETTAVYFRVGATGTGANQVTSKASGIEPLIFNYLGLTETKLHNYKQAIQWLDSAIRLQPKEADFLVNRGIAKEAIKDSTAVLDYEKALVINPDQTAARANMANLKRNKGKQAESMDELEKAIESDSSMLQPYLARAFQRMEAGYFKGALADYDKAIEMDSKNAEIWMNRGIVKEKLNNLKGAFSDYTVAIELNEKYEKAWLNRGNVLLKQGKFKEASEDYTVALTFNPEYAFAHYNRAVAFQKLKLLPQACDDLKKAESLGYTVDPKVKKEICK
ncbi:MAG: tetratricopeptide repeat protein [Chryseolinea sp.]